MKKNLTNALFGLGFSLLVCQAEGGEIRFREGRFYLEASRSSGIVALFHADAIRQPKSEWDFVMLAPKGERTFEITSFLQKESIAGFFELRRQDLEIPEQMLWIAPGKFLLGSPDSESGRYEDEGPRHEVHIENGFWISRFEVTQSEYESLMKTNPSRATGSPHRPVENVRWFDAVEYCQVFNQKKKDEGNLPIGYEYRLPTEAEWEYACRAGTQTAFCFGEDVEQLSRYAWWGNNSGATPLEVGLLKPNDWGLYDMHGNVFEWCQNKYEAYPGGKIRNLKIDYRAVRGGAFICPPEVLRSACRFESAPARSASWLIGFRLALAPILK